MAPTAPTDAFYAVKRAAERDAAACYGVKLAEGVLPRLGRFLFSHHPLPEGGYPGALGGVKNVGHVAADVARDMVLGSPVDLARELQANRASTGSWPRAVGQQAKNFYFTPGKGFGARAMQALSLGLPALELGSAVFGDPAHRGERVGGALAGIATSPFVARLGLAGGVVQAPAVAVGQRVGRLFDPKQEPAAEEQPPGPAYTSSGQLAALSRPPAEH